MNQSHSIFQRNQSKKAHHDMQYPNDFHFHYQKSDNECFDQMSPTSTCPSEGKSAYWQYQSDQKMMETEMHSSLQSTIEFGCLEGNLLGGCLEKYSTAVSDYIKDCLNQESEKVYEFVLVKEYQGLDLQKQEFSNILTKYYRAIKSTNSLDDNFFVQNSTLRTFMEEITYLNYEQINFQLISIITQIYGFKLSGKWETKDIKEFFDRLSQKPSLQYINFNFIQQKIEDKRRQKSFVHFLEKLFQIVSELYIHYKVFQTEQDQCHPGINQPQIIRNQVKLFSSQRDIWDSDEQEDFLRLSCPSKKVKFFDHD